MRHELGVAVDTAYRVHEALGFILQLGLELVLGLHLGGALCLNLELELAFVLVFSLVLAFTEERAGDFRKAAEELLVLSLVLELALDGWITPVQRGHGDLPSELDDRGLRPV